jgi:sterol desaturase/sphingolipid hydroxylase (fatty acid hydroxylase superfamily)
MWEAVAGIPERLWHVLASPGSDYSALSLLSALLIATLFLSLRRSQLRRPLRLGVLARALFPKRLLHSRSARADIKYFALNVLFLGSLLGWAILSATWISGGLYTELNETLGAQSPSSLPSWAVMAITTLALFLAYEFAYWFEHYLSHTVPLLWEFHKVHHSAEVLSPLTNARIHPVNAIIFLNMVAVCVGGMRGTLDFLFGAPVTPFTIAHTNVLFVLFTFATAHLQHSHVWIAFTGMWGWLLLSPAHHQIHHSRDPRHFNKNFGSSLALFDWAFGTLYIPSKERERLTFGADEINADHNTLTGGLCGPIRAVVARLGAIGGRRPAAPTAPPRAIAAE